MQGLVESEQAGTLIVPLLPWGGNQSTEKEIALGQEEQRSWVQTQPESSLSPAAGWGLPWATHLIHFTHQG